MPEKDPIDLIREQLNRADNISALHSNHEAFQQWYNETIMILEKIFTSKSIHSQNFSALRFQEVSIKAFSSPEIDKINTARFKKDLEVAKNILQSAIKELTLDRTLFKKLQTTPKRVEVVLKGDYFISSEIKDPKLLQAIENGFEGSGLNPVHPSDPIHERKDLLQRIDQIRQARFGIYDLSTPERIESFIELGIALGLGKEVILIYKKGALLPEAIQSLNRIEYENPLDLSEKLRKSR